MKSLRFIASVDNELIQMENVFKAINVKLKNDDLVSVETILKNNEIIDPDSDNFFRGLKTRLNLLAIYKDALQNLPLKPPMEHYYVSSSYGPRKHPVTGKYRMHHVSFLGYPHRHMFHFRVSIEVFHDDREVEFIQFSRWLQRLFSENVMTLDYKSCEMIADDMFLEIRKKYGSNREVHIEVSEDGENGCVVTFPKA